MNHYIIETQYFPCIDYFKLAAKASDYKIEQWENFQKMSFRNRCIIAGSNGLIGLTVPVKGGREQKKLIKDIEIDYTIDWKTVHCRSIASSYAGAAFFDFYSQQAFELITRPYKYLM